MSAKILVSTENLPYADWLEYRKQGIGGSEQFMEIVNAAELEPNLSEAS